MVEGEQQALTIEDVSCAFGATQALDRVTFSIAKGAIHALLGENGSGKSTLVKILAGVCQADNGAIGRRGERVPAAHITPTSSVTLGLRFVHQSPSTFARLTVQENIAIGAGFPTQAGRIRWRELRKQTQGLLDRYEIPATPSTLLGALRPADQTMVAVARALSDSDENDDLVLVLDEPTASLPDHEVDVLLGSLRHCVGVGHTIVYVSHRIEEVLSFADSVTVLRDGRHVITRGVAGLTDAELITHIIGRSIGSAFPPSGNSKIGEPVLEVSHLSGGPLRDASFVARAGEIVGIAGLLGSGRTELLQMIFGAYPRDSGEISVQGRTLENLSPQSAIKAGLGLVPEDRHRDAAYVNLTVRENLSITRVDHYWRRFYFAHRAERQNTKRYMDLFAIRAGGPEELLSSLSGGNQQKTILARWLSMNPRVLLLDEPTQGIDVGARAEAYESIRDAVSRGMAALLVSSDFEELAQVADRVLILRDGRITRELTPPEMGRLNISHAVYDSDPIPA